MLDKATQDKLQKDVQSYRLITVATLVDRLKINGSLARQSLKDLEDKGQIKKVVGHSKLSIYSKLLAPSPFLRFFVLSEWENECSERGGREEGREVGVQKRQLRAKRTRKLYVQRKHLGWLHEIWILNEEKNTQTRSHRNLRIPSANACGFSARAVTAAE